MSGEVQINIGGNAETLRCTLRAAKAVNALGGFSEVFRRLAGFDLDCYVAVVAAGLGKKPADVEQVVYDTGLANLTEPLSEFVSLLANGGKPAVAEGTAKGEG